VSRPLLCPTLRVVCLIGWKVPKSMQVMTHGSWGGLPSQTAMEIGQLAKFNDSEACLLFPSNYFSKKLVKAHPSSVVSTKLPPSGKYFSISSRAGSLLMSAGSTPSVSSVSKKRR